MFTTNPTVSPVLALNSCDLLIVLLIRTYIEKKKEHYKQKKTCQAREAFEFLKTPQRFKKIINQLEPVFLPLN